VDACSHSTEALRRLRQQAYDIVASNLRMPVMDGIALLGQARELQPTRCASCWWVQAPWRA
jgi:CheY-like chemotaxis protein